MRPEIINNKEYFRLKEDYLVNAALSIALNVSKIKSLVSHPSVDTGKAGGAGLGWPKAIQKENIKPVKTPVIAPRWLADSQSIPKVNIPNNGPPTTPKIVKLACE